jgi:hypothetical protein
MYSLFAEKEVSAKDLSTEEETANDTAQTVSSDKTEEPDLFKTDEPQHDVLTDRYKSGIEHKKSL